MMMNASFMEKELPSVALSEHLRLAIENVCSSLIGTKHDIVTELGELRDLVEANASADVKSRIERILRWLEEELPKLDAVVTSLEAAKAADGAAGTAYVLVAESAVNVIRKFVVVSDAEAAYRDSLGHSAPQPIP